MKSLKIVLVSLIVIAGLLLIVAAFLPEDVKMDSSISIKSTDNVVFNQVNNLKNWEKWTPFTSEDMTSNYSGAEYGVGAIYSWESEELGNGTLEIIESVPFKSIRSGLDFKKQARAYGYWTFTPVDDKVDVVWAVEMTNLPYPIGRLMGLLAPTMMQNHFDVGLSQLKEVCESLINYTGIIEEDLAEVSAFSIIDSCKIEDIGPLMGKNYSLIMKYLGKNNIEMAGVPFAIYHKWNPSGYTIVEAGIPADNSMGGKDDIIASSLKAGRVVSFVHFGPYENMEKSHNLISSYIMDCGYSSFGSPWEMYLSDPTTVADPSEIQTKICYPIE